MTTPTSPLGQSVPHESGLRHTTGAALYVDDLPPPHGMLVAKVLMSTRPHATFTMDTTAASTVAGVHTILTAKDIPGHNQMGPVLEDEPLMADGTVHCVGQIMGVVVGESYPACRAAAAAVKVTYQDKPAVLSIADAIAAGTYIGTPHVMVRGDVEAALSRATVRITGTLESGGQDHFYLETHCALAVPGENRTFTIHSSTQHPSEVQAKVAEVLGLSRSAVVVECPRMGGGFGGKETQGAHFAALAALASLRTGRPVKVWLNRDDDMVMTGKRHPAFSRFDAGLDAHGRILGIQAEVFADGGWCADLSLAICDRALFHLDNSYFIPAARLEGRVARTNLVSNTAFRGFGGPQGMLVVEEILNRAAERLGLDPAEVRERNYYGDAPRNVTPYHQEITHNRMPRIHAELLPSAAYAQRRASIDRFNERSPVVRRGIGFQPVKFGISFTHTILNQAGAFVNIFTDGTVQLNHGGTEMGQGLHTKMLAVAAHQLGVPVDVIRVMHTATDKVPNTSATAASSGSDLNGAAVKAACATLRQRLGPVAADVLGVPADQAQAIVFEGGRVHLPGHSQTSTFLKVVQRAYWLQVSMSATGYYRTPGIHYDRQAGRGQPFHYFAYGGAVVEVEINGLTGEHRAVRVDILHDVGDSLIPSIDRGQVEGAFIQGLGWLTCEEVLFDPQGRLLTHSPSTYKIPAVGEAPEDFHLELLADAPQPGVIHGSKAVGEPPFMLAIGAVTALRHAVASFGEPCTEVNLALPATPEAVLRAIEDIRQRGNAASVQAQAG